MAGLKPLTNKVEKVVSHVKLANKGFGVQALSVKSNLKGLKYSPIQKDALTLTAQPKKYASQAERLKDFFESKGYTFHLPHQEWSDKKILDSIGLLSNDLDKLVESKTLNKQTLKKAIEKLAPETKGKIIIKDFGDFEKDLRAKGWETQAIADFLADTSAITTTSKKKTKLYFNFENLNGTKFEQVELKSDIEHEIEHAFVGVLQNTATTDIFKSNEYKNIGQTKIFNKIFNLFEGNYTDNSSSMQVELTQKNMLNSVGFNSIKELHRDFDATLNSLIKNGNATGELNMSPDKKSFKEFFNFLKHMAKDEKQAYQSNKRYREINEDLNTPTNSEFTPMLYAEMEKFFEQKRIQVNKQIPSP